MASTVFFAALLLGGVVLLGYTVTRVIGGGIAPSPGPRTAEVPSARRVLDERYARGDLSTDEYRDRVRTLEEER